MTVKVERELVPSSDDYQVPDDHPLAGLMEIIEVHPPPKD
jgi:hypothetical protein